MKQGHGKQFISVEDRIYEGQFKNGQRHGQGKLLSGDGTKVLEKGTWKHDQK
jgi:hypothetical protein